MAKKSKSGSDSRFNYLDHLSLDDRRVVEPYKLQLRKGDSNYLAGIVDTPSFGEELLRVVYERAMDTVQVDPEMRDLLIAEHGDSGPVFWRSMLDIHKPVVATTEVTWTEREAARWHTA